MASTYNISRKRRIADGRYTAVTLLICSLIFWGAGALLGVGLPGSRASEWMGDRLMAIDTLLLRGASLLLFVVAASLAGSFMVPERRMTWQSTLMLWIAATTFGIQADVPAAFTLLLFVVVVGLLYYSDAVADARRMLYGIFALVTAISLFFPQFIILLPLLLLYPATNNSLTIKSFFASLLGVATPVWVVAALFYLFPQLQPLLDGTREQLATLLQAPRVAVTPSMLLRLGVELAVTIPAIIHFCFTATVGRIYLRRRMIFGMTLYAVLWLAGWLQPQLYTLFFIWRLPMMAMLAAYIFPALPPKTSNVYMLSTTLLWAASAIVELWIG